MSSIAQITGSSPAMLKKLEAEVRLVFSIAVRDFGFDAHAVESIIQSRGYAVAITSNKTETKEEKKENQEVRCGPNATVLSYLKIRIKKKLSEN